MPRLAPDDLRATIAVNEKGQLGLITTPTGVLGILPDGQRWASTQRRPIVLGRFADWFYSGRPFKTWLRDLGYQNPNSIQPDTQEIFLRHAQAMGVL